MENNEYKPQPYTPKKVWFFQRKSDGMIFPAEEKEAWGILQHRNNWKRRDFELLGVSNGKKFAEIMNSAGSEAKLIKLEIDKIQNEIDKYQKTEEKFKFDDLLDDTDPKMIKLRGLIDGLYDRLEVLQTDYNARTREVKKRAEEAELEIARGNMEYPGNTDIDTPGASGFERNRVLRSMGQK